MQNTTTGATIRNIVRKTDLTSGPKINLPRRINTCMVKPAIELVNAHIMTNLFELGKLKETINKQNYSQKLVSLASHKGTCHQKKLLLMKRVVKQT